MTQIALYDYLGQINQFLEDEQTIEAISHCRHVLRQLPRHVDTYRLLARALLENREFEDAAELFRRILSADPNDFVAHVGLAEIYREAGEISEAVWHMERAFEMSPYDPAVYEVLRDLYTQRDGEALTEIPLTRAALARLYFKGELYQEAAQELRTILQQNGDERVDLEVLLSETLWRDNQRVDAVAVALKVLEKLPDSIIVNAILGEVWLLTGRREEAQDYLQHLLSLTQMDQKHLDLDSVVGQALQTDGAPPLPKTVLVERWRATADADRFDAGTRVGTEQPIEDEAVYDWLREDGGTDVLGALVDEEDETDWFTDRLEMPSDQEEAFAKTTEWLDSIGVEPESGDDFDFAADVPDELVAEDEMPAQMDESLLWSEETADVPEPDQFVHDWLAEIDDTTVEEIEEDEEEQSEWFTSALTDEADEPDESDWFDALLDDESDEEMPERFDETLVENEMEDAPESQVLHTADLMTQTDEDALDWLVEEEEAAPLKGSQELSELAEASLAEESLAGEDESLPDWLLEISDAPETLDFGEPEPEDKISLFADDEEPVGTGDLFASDIEEWEEEADFDFNTADLLANASEGLPDWLTEEKPSAEEQKTGGLSDILGTTGLLSDTDLPDWLSDEEDMPEAETEERESGLIRHMNRMMGTDELFADEEIDIDFEEEVEEPESEPLSLTGLLLGTAELVEQEAADEPHEPDEETIDASEPDESVVTGGFPALLGTAELLADLGTEVPDWLQEEEPLAQPESPLQTTDLQGESLDEVPHWLFREEETEEEKPEEESPQTAAPKSGVIGTAELFTNLGEDVPDWVEEADEEEGEEEVSAGQQSGLLGTAELLAELDVDVPDWVSDQQETTGWQPSDTDGDELLPETDEDAWLTEEAPMDESIADIVEEATPPTKSLLDWLSGEPVSSVATDFDEADEEELPDWLFSDTSQDEMEAVIMAENEQEDNLEEVPDDSDDMDWLEELVAQEDAPAAHKQTPTTGEGDLPDWLSDLTEPATDSEAALSEEDDVTLTLTDTDLPDWLKDLGEATAPAQEAISGSMENLPDWLKPPPDLDIGSVEDSDFSESMEADALPELADDAIGTDDLLDFDETDKSDKDDTSQIWLDALAAGQDDFDLEPEPISEADEAQLPDWLALSGDTEAMTMADTAAADEDESVLDFLSDSEDAFLLNETDDDLDFDQGEAETSDWLTALMADDEDSVETAAEDEDILDLLDESDTETVLDFGESEDEAAEDEALPDWLMESVSEETVAAVEPTDDFDALEDEDMEWLSALATEGEADEAESADDVLDLFADVDTDLFDFDETAADDLDIEEVEETPDWLEATAGADELDEMVADLVDEDVEALPDWLASEVNEAEGVETAVTDDVEDDLLPELSLDDEDDLALDDPMAWLDQLAVEQDEPVEDLPSVLDTSMYEAISVDDLADELLADETEEEAALSWLDGLDKADDFDDLTTVVTATADEAATELDIEADELLETEVELTVPDLTVADDETPLDWLDALDESETMLAEEMETAVTPTEDFLETVDVPDDLEEAMAWLDNLEAETEEPDEDLPTLDDLLLIEEDVEVETAAADEDEIGWLAELTAEDMEEAVEEPLTVAEIEGEPEPSDPLQEALDRLEEMAIQDSASFLTTDVPDPDEAIAAESLDEVLDWLEAQLTKPTDEEAAEEPVEVVDESDDLPDVDVLIAEETVIVEAPIMDVDVDVMEEEDETETADAPLPEEMLDLPDIEEAIEVEEPTDEPDEMSDDEITAFMDAILEDDDSFIPGKDVSFTPDDPDAIPSFAATTVDTEEESVVEMEETAAEPLLEIETTTDESLLDEIPDFVEETVTMDEADEMSDDDILAFMDAILDDDDSFIPEKDVAFNPDDPDALPSFAASTTVEEVASEAEAEADKFVDVMADLTEEEDEAEVLAGMYDDLSDDMSDDDILAFMDAVLDDEDSFVPEKDVSFNPDDPDAVPSFAPTQTAAVDPDDVDLGDVSDDDPDLAIAWLEDLAEAQEDAEDEEDLDSILPEIDEDFAVGLFADVEEVEETADSQDAIEFDETLADSLPEWLEFDGEEQLSGHTDWLRSLPEPDVAGWLEAEEEVMATNIFDEIPVPAEPERPSTYASIEEEPEPEDDLPEAEREVEVEAPTSAFSLNTGVLDRAREALIQGEYEQAMSQYRSLVEEGQGLSALIADLETATEEYQQPLLRRLLGDAYMRNGQLQRALETYRIALDEL